MNINKLNIWKKIVFALFGCSYSPMDEEQKIQLRIARNNLMQSMARLNMYLKNNPTSWLNLK